MKPAASEILARAADILERDGWGPGDTQLHCAWTAIVAATRDAGGHADDAMAAARVVERRTGVELVEWNDSPGMTLEKVVKELRR